MDPKKSSLNFNTAADVLQGLLQNSKSPLANPFTCWRISQDWVKIVGQTIAEQTVPVGYNNGTFYVLCSHPVWIQQMSFMVDAMRDKINAHVGRPWVTKVRFTLERRIIESP